MEKQGQTIKDLVIISSLYESQTWFSKDWWTKLTSAYSNLNHVMAAKIVEVMKTDNASSEFDTAGYGKDFAQLLVNTRVSISALIGVMNKNNLSFSGKNFYMFLDTLHKKYVKAPGLFTEEIMARMEYVKELPFVGKDTLTSEERKYIQNPETPLELVDMLIQKPKDMTAIDYKKFIESVVKDNPINTSRKIEVILLGLKNLMSYKDDANKTEIQALAALLRGPDEGQNNSIEPQQNDAKKDEKVKTFLKKAANSASLQRQVKRYVMGKLLNNQNELTVAAATISGHGNVQKMADMLNSVDQETFTLIGAVMSQTMSEIQSEHNLNPEFWNGNMSRGWNKFTSYPAAAFFAVMDFFAIVFAYIYEYTARGACKAYEGVCALVGKPVTNKRDNQDIFKETDFEDVMVALVESLKVAKVVDKTTVKLDPKAELKDAILDVFKSENNITMIKDKLLNIIPADANNVSNELKTAIHKIKDRRDLQSILDMPEMNQNISNALPSWAEAAKSVSILANLL